MTAQQNKANYRRIIEEVWNQGNLALADELCSPNYVGHDPSMTLRGLEQFKQYVAAYRNAFPDTRMTIEEEIAEGDIVVIRWISSGTHQGNLMGIPPTGKQIRVTGMSMIRFVNGKCEEAWFNYDTLGMMQQLGVLPAM